MDIFNDFQTELNALFSHLNWTFILIYVFVLYGIKYKEEFEWYNEFMDAHPNLMKLKVWMAGIITASLFALFHYLEEGMKPEYVSQLLRSFIIVVVFNSISIKGIIRYIDKADKEEEKKSNQ